MEMNFGAVPICERETAHGKGRPESWWAVNVRRPTAKGIRSIVELWMQDAPPHYGKVWVWCWQRKIPGAFSSRERKIPHILMGTSEFDGDRNIKKDYCKVLFAEGVVTEVWDISQMRTDLEVNYYSSVVLASEFQVLLYYPWFFNSSYAVMISTLTSFEDLHNINACLRPGKMNGYAEAPG